MTETMQLSDCDATVEAGEVVLVSGDTSINLTEHELSILLFLVQQD